VGAGVSFSLIEPSAVDTPLPQHARNYLAHEPTLPAPRLDPHQVADAILQAATTPTRSLKVGAMAGIGVAMEKLIPGVVDVLSVFQVPRQQTDVPPRDPAGTLFKPGSEGRIYGHGGKAG
jgi:hypothetical protein